jgi:hypothetical protein
MDTKKVTVATLTLGLGLAVSGIWVPTAQAGTATYTPVTGCSATANWSDAYQGSSMTHSNKVTRSGGTQIQAIVTVHNGSSSTMYPGPSTTATSSTASTTASGTSKFAGINLWCSGTLHPAAFGW